MLTFLKAQAASLIASLIDFLVTVLAVEVLGMVYVAATVTGNISGGVSNFLLGRQWVFDAADKQAKKQAFRYLLVWCGNLALNAGGMYLLADYWHVNYALSKVLVSVLVGISYNYLLQKTYVFS
jgi:putative flippase GtrA